MFHSRRNQSRATGPPNHPLREKVTLQSVHTTLMEGRTTSRHSGIMKKEQKKNEKKKSGIMEDWDEHVTYLKTLLRAEDEPGFQPMRNSSSSSASS